VCQAIGQLQSFQLQFFTVSCVTRSPLSTLKYSTCHGHHPGDHPLGTPSFSSTNWGWFSRHCSAKSLWKQKKNIQAWPSLELVIKYVPSALHCMWVTELVLPGAVMTVTNLQQWVVPMTCHEPVNHPQVEVCWGRFPGCTVIFVLGSHALQRYRKPPHGLSGVNPSHPKIWEAQLFKHPLNPVSIWQWVKTLYPW